LSINSIDGVTTIKAVQNTWLTGGNTGVGANWYIGTNDNTDFVLKSNGQEGLRISNSNASVAGNLGVGGILAPVTAAQINGALALQDTVVNVSGNVTLNAGNRSSFLINTSVSPASAVCALSNGQVPGQLLMVMVSKVNSVNNGVTFAPGNNLRLTGSNGSHSYVTLSDGGVITFIWNGTQWLQSSISNNN